MDKNWCYIKSSDLQAVKFENDILSIMFLDGSIYEYYGANYIIFNNLLNSYSKGRFFHENIKQYPYKKIK